MSKRRWADREIEYLLANPPTKLGDYDRLAEELGRTSEAVRYKCRKLKLPAVKRSSQAKRVDLPLEERLIKFFKAKRNKAIPISELQEMFGVTRGEVIRAVDTLQRDQNYLFAQKGGTLELLKQQPTGGMSFINVEDFFGERIKFGFTADNHLGSKYERLDVLEALFDVYEREGVTTVYQAGNMIDGEFRFNRFDLLVHGFEEQVAYFVEHWPRREGITTYFITGDDHEGWYISREHVNVGERIADVARKAGREDLVFLGHMEHDIVLEAPKGHAKLRIIHAGGGSTYAVSYTSQKYVESLMEGEKPDVVLVGHFHKMEYYRPRGVMCLQGGCTQDQTPFMRKKRIRAELGGWIVELNQAPDGSINRFRAEDLRFYGKGFYEKWRYRW